MGELEQRIRQKAHELWEQEGRPEGRSDVHWEKARILVAIEDDHTSIVPVTPPKVEEASLNNNLGEFPSATGNDNLDPQILAPPPQPEPQAERPAAAPKTAKAPKNSKAPKPKAKERDSLLGAFKKGRE
jgi:Protein of unknown function (DUF2934)